MKNIIIGSGATLFLFGSLWFTSSFSNEQAEYPVVKAKTIELPSKLNNSGEICPCTPDCLPDDPWCYCPASCEE